MRLRSWLRPLALVSAVGLIGCTDNPSETGPNRAVGVGTNTGSGAGVPEGTGPSTGVGSPLPGPANPAGAGTGEMPGGTTATETTPATTTETPGPVPESGVARPESAQGDLDLNRDGTEPPGGSR